MSWVNNDGEGHLRYQHRSPGQPPHRENKSVVRREEQIGDAVQYDYDFQDLKRQKQAVKNMYTPVAAGTIYGKSYSPVGHALPPVGKVSGPFNPRGTYSDMSAS